MNATLTRKARTADQGRTPRENGTYTYGVDGLRIRFVGERGTGRHEGDTVEVVALGANPITGAPMTLVAFDPARTLTRWVPTADVIL